MIYDNIIPNNEFGSIKIVKLVKPSHSIFEKLLPFIKFVFGRTKCIVGYTIFHASE